MSAFLLKSFLVLCATFVTNEFHQLDNIEDCAFPDLGSYQYSMYDIGVPIYKAISRLSNVNFVFAPHSIWILLAAIAEGSDKKTQEELFKILNLPDDSCVRQKYYQIATTRIPNNNISIVNTRMLIIDEETTINKDWLNFVSKNALLDVVKAPIKSNPYRTINEIQKFMTANLLGLDLTGNSVLLDTIDHNELWTTAFADAVIEKSPFYNLQGEQIGFVDLMKVKRRARMGYVKSMNAKVLELPVGVKGQYRMLLVIMLDKEELSTKIKNLRKDIVIEMVNSLKESNVPLDIAIPRIKVSSQLDIKTVLQEVGVNNLWTDPQATKFISSPSAFPSSYAQRATVILDKHGVAGPPIEPDPPLELETSTGLDPKVGTDFIANHPFLFGLVDAETISPIVAIGFGKPTYDL